MTEKRQVDLLYYTPGVDENGCVWELHPSHYTMLKRNLHTGKQDMEGFVVTSSAADMMIRSGTVVYITPSTFTGYSKPYTFQDPIPFFVPVTSESLPKSGSQRAVKVERILSEGDIRAVVAESYDDVELTDEQAQKVNEFVPHYVNTSAGILPYYTPIQSTPPMPNPMDPQMQAGRMEPRSHYYTQEVDWSTPVNVSVPPPGFGVANPQLADDFCSTPGEVEILDNRHHQAWMQSRFHQHVDPQPLYMDISEFQHSGAAAQPQEGFGGPMDVYQNNAPQSMESGPGSSPPLHPSEIELKELVLDEQWTVYDDYETKREEAMVVDGLAGLVIEGHEHTGASNGNTSSAQDTQQRPVMGSAVLESAKLDIPGKSSTTPFAQLSSSLTTCVRTNGGILDGVPSKESLADSSFELGLEASSCPGPSTTAPVYKIDFSLLANRTTAADVASTSSVILPKENLPTINSIVSDGYVIDDIMTPRDLLKERSSLVNRRILQAAGSSLSSASLAVDVPQQENLSVGSDERAGKLSEEAIEIIKKEVIQSVKKTRAQKKRERKQRKQLKKVVEQEAEDQEDKLIAELKEKDQDNELETFPSSFFSYILEIKNHRVKHYALRKEGYGHLYGIQHDIVNFYFDKMFLAMDMLLRQETDILKFFQCKTEEYESSGEFRLQAFCELIGNTFADSRVVRQDALWLYSQRNGGFEGALRNLYTFILYSPNHKLPDAVVPSEQFLRSLNFPGVNVKGFHDYLVRSISFREPFCLTKNNKAKLPSVFEIKITEDYIQRKDISLYFVRKDLFEFMNGWVEHFQKKNMEKHVTHLGFLMYLESDIIHYDISKLAAELDTVGTITEQQSRVCNYLQNVFDDTSFRKFYPNVPAQPASKPTLQ